MTLRRSINPRSLKISSLRLALRVISRVKPRRRTRFLRRPLPSHAILKRHNRLLYFLYRVPERGQGISAEALRTRLKTSLPAKINHLRLGSVGRMTTVCFSLALYLNVTYLIFSSQMR